MGYGEEAEASFERALEAARDGDDTETEGWVQMTYVWSAHASGKAEQALAHASQGYEIAERMGSTFSRVWATYYLGYARHMVGESQEGATLIERSIEVGREARTALEFESQRLAALSAARLGAGDPAGALEAAEESVQLAHDRSNEAMLSFGYRVLAEALLASEKPGGVAAARDALDAATTAAETTGMRAELPLIEHARQKLVPVA
jgi:tetratricopeptide (TPR) repeat protein